MRVTKANSSKFEYIVGQALKEYEADVSKAMLSATEDAMSEAMELLQNAGEPHWKKFNKSWKKTVTQNSRGLVEGYVHLKKPYYRIGHLLEFDHASRNGGRTVSGFHFIQPIAEKVPEIFEEKFKHLMGNYKL